VIFSQYHSVYRINFAQFLTGLQLLNYTKNCAHLMGPRHSLCIHRSLPLGLCSKPNETSSSPPSIPVSLRSVFNSIWPCVLRSFRRPHPFKFSDQNFVYLFHALTLSWPFL
jgi:hypothetical protein